MSGDLVGMHGGVWESKTNSASVKTNAPMPAEERRWGGEESGGKETGGEESQVQDSTSQLEVSWCFCKLNFTSKPHI